MSLILSIDPGLKGGIVAIDNGGQIIRAFPMPIIKGSNELSMIGLYDCFLQFVKARIVVEKQVGMPGQSSTSTLTSGQNWGKIIGMISTLQLCDNMREFSLEYVAPVTWSKHLHKNVSCKADTPTKVKTELALLQKYGKLPPTFYNRNGKLHDGMADALGICHWYLETQVKG